MRLDATLLIGIRSSFSRENIANKSEPAVLLPTFEERFNRFGLDRFIPLTFRNPFTVALLFLGLPGIRLHIITRIRTVQINPSDKLIPRLLRQVEFCVALCAPSLLGRLGPENLMFSKNDLSGFCQHRLQPVGAAKPVVLRATKIRPSKVRVVYFILC